MIHIHNLECRYPDGTLAIRNLNLIIQRGEFLLLCGPNGSGKTTLIRHISGLLKPTAGSITISREEPGTPHRNQNIPVGMVFQDADSQIIGQTVEEDVAFGPQNLGLPSDEVQHRVEEALNVVGLARFAKKSCHLLSGGEKRRLAIAGVLAVKPDIFIFDEPFANLDYSGTRQVLKHILAFHRQGHTIILATHDVEKVIAHVDRVAILHEGELKVCGAPQNVLGHLKKYHIRPPCYALLGKEPQSWLVD